MNTQERRPEKPNLAKVGGILAILTALALAGCIFPPEQSKPPTYWPETRATNSTDLGVWETPHGILANISPAPPTIYVRENVTTTAYPAKVYYGCNVSRANLTHVTDFFDDFTNNTTSSYTMTGVTWFWNATSGRIYTENVAQGYIAPTTQYNLSTTGYVVEADAEYNVYGAGLDYEYGIGTCGFQSTVASSTTGFCGTFDPIFLHGSTYGQAILKVNDNYYNTTPASNALNKVVHLRGRFKSGSIEFNVTRPENTSVTRSYRVDSSYTEGYYGWRMYSSKVNLDNLLVYSDCAAPTLVYGDENTGTYNFSKTNCTKYRDLTITGAANQTNCTFYLDYNYFNSSNLLITNYSFPSAETATPQLVIPANGSTFNTTTNPTITFNFSVGNFSSNYSCNARIDGSTSYLANNSGATSHQFVNTTTSFSVGLHNWTVNCTSATNISSNSSVWYFTVATPANLTYRMPTGISDVNFTCLQPYMDNVFPNGQGPRTPIFNFTNSGGVMGGNITLALNQSLPTGFVIRAQAANYVNPGSITVNTTAQVIVRRLNVNESKGVWLIANCTNVTDNQTLWLNYTIGGLT